MGRYGKCDKKPSPACVIDGLQGANVLIKKMSIPPIVLLVYRSTVYDHAADDFIEIVPSDHKKERKGDII